MRAGAVLVGERRALVFRYGDVGTVLLSLFMVWWSCVECRDVQYALVCGYGDVVRDCACAPRGCKLWRKPSDFHRRSLWVLFLRNAWFDIGYTTVPGCCWTYLPRFLREGRNSDPEVDFVLLSGVEV